MSESKAKERGMDLTAMAAAGSVLEDTGVLCDFEKEGHWGDFRPRLVSHASAAVKAAKRQATKAAMDAHNKAREPGTVVLVDPIGLTPEARQQIRIAEAVASIRGDGLGTLTYTGAEGEPVTFEAAGASTEDSQRHVRAAAESLAPFSNASWFASELSNAGGVLAQLPDLVPDAEVLAVTGKGYVFGLRVHLDEIASEARDLLALLKRERLKSAVAKRSAAATRTTSSRKSKVRSVDEPATSGA